MSLPSNVDQLTPDTLLEPPVGSDLTPEVWTDLVGEFLMANGGTIQDATFAISMRLGLLPVTGDVIVTHPNDMVPDPNLE